MLERETPDVVSVCVPTRAHPEVAIEVAAHAPRGVKAIFLEKPIAQSLAEADRMIDAFGRHAVAVAVNHTRTWDPLYAAIRRLIAGGAIGAVHSVVAHGREGALFGGVHLYDLLRSLLRREPEWVTGELEPGTTFDPAARGVIAFPDGIRAYVNLSEADPTGFEIDVTGTEGRIRAGNALYPEWWQVDRSGGGRPGCGAPSPAATTAAAPCCAPSRTCSTAPRRAGRRSPPPPTPAPTWRSPSPSTSPTGPASASGSPSRTPPTSSRIPGAARRLPESGGDRGARGARGAHGQCDPNCRYRRRDWVWNSRHSSVRRSCSRAKRRAPFSALATPGCPTTPRGASRCRSGHWA